MNEPACAHDPAPCTMQIAVSDRDYAYALYVLPHQMRVLGKFSADVLISVNRFEPPKNPELLDGLLNEISSQHRNVRIEEVEYSTEARNWVSETFFGGKDYPLFDFKGIPIHAILEPLRKGRYKYFFRLDGDMMLGGTGPWFHEAIEVLKSDPKIMAINPLAGPRNHGPYHSGGVEYQIPLGEAFRVDLFTTRTLLVQLESFFKAMDSLDELPPKRLTDRLFTRVAGYPMVDHLEILFQQRMIDMNSFRVDLGGTGNLWTLHPRFKTSQYVQNIADIIDKVESSNLPQEQIGHYDLHKSVFNQTDLPTRATQIKYLVALGKDRLSTNRKPQELRSHYFQ